MVTAVTCPARDGGYFGDLPEACEFPAGVLASPPWRRRGAPDLATLQPNTSYSVDYQAERMKDDGASESYVATSIFHVIDVVHSHGRPDLMHTVGAADDVVLAAPVAMSVQIYDTWDR